MSRKKAALILDPDRRAEQMAYVSERVEILHEVGGQLWVSMTEAQTSRFAQYGILVQLHEEADLIELPAVVFDPADGDPEPPEDLRATAPAPGELAHYLVRFVAPADPAWINEIVYLGGSFVQNLPVNVGVFRLTADRAAAVDALEYVTWVGLYHPAYALSYRLAGRREPFDVVSLRGLGVAAGSVPAGDDGNIRIRLFDDVVPGEVRPSVEAVATITSEIGPGFVVSATPATVRALLGIPGVLAVEPFFAPRLKNDGR